MTDMHEAQAGEKAFGTIPDYVTPENRARILELSEPNEKEISDVECTEYLIRHWLETVEDANPLYNDREYARSRGFKDIIAQPGMNICTLTMPYRLTADTGIDSLCHALEAYVSRKSNPFTDSVALTAMRTINRNIRTACNEPDNRDCNHHLGVIGAQSRQARTPQPSSRHSPGGEML